VGSSSCSTLAKKASRSACRMHRSQGVTSGFWPADDLPMGVIATDFGHTRSPFRASLRIFLDNGRNWARLAGPRDNFPLGSVASGNRCRPVARFRLLGYVPSSLLGIQQKRAWALGMHRATHALAYFSASGNRVGLDRPRVEVQAAAEASASLPRGARAKP
jgi:hypothetical protein